MDHYIKFDGVEGESVSKDHKGEIEVLSWSWGLSSPGSPAGGGGGGGGGRAGRATPEQFTFTHLYDKASPVLASLVAAGRHVKEAWFSSRRSGDGQKDFLKVTMSEVLITGVHQQGDAEGISETVTASARRIVFEYRETDEKGSLGSPVTFDWDIVKSIVK
jgi:type VI secretion system secreted protein Hcp